MSPIRSTPSATARSRSRSASLSPGATARTPATKKQPPPPAPVFVDLQLGGTSVDITRPSGQGWTTACTFRAVAEAALEQLRTMQAETAGLALPDDPALLRFRTSTGMELTMHSERLLQYGHALQ